MKPVENVVEYSPEATKKDGRILVLAAAIITGLRLALDPRAGSKTERVIDAVEDGIWLANQIYDKALLRFSQGNIEYRW
jgi:hypothetical protein